MQDMLLFTGSLNSPRYSVQSVVVCPTWQSAISRRVRGKARCRLRYNKWVNSMDNWLSNEAPKLADFDKRQFPEQNIRWGGSMVP